MGTVSNDDINILKLAKFLMKLNSDLANIG